MQRVDYRAGRQEQARLEEGVCNNVKYRDRKRTGPHGGEHETKLADRRIGQYPLEIPLQATRGRADERRDNPYYGDDREPPRRQSEQEAKSRDQIDTRGDHGGGVNQR